MRKLIYFLIALLVLPIGAVAQTATWGSGVVTGSLGSPTGYVDTQTRQIVRIQSPGAVSDNFAYMCSTETPGSGGSSATFIAMFKGNQAGTPTSFTEQNSAGHPADSGSGFIDGADCRSAGTIIYVVYQLANTKTAYLKTFDTVANTWGAQETIGTYSQADPFWRYEHKISMAIDASNGVWVTWGGIGSSDSIHLSYRTSPGSFSSEVVPGTSGGAIRPTMLWDKNGNLDLAFLTGTGTGGPLSGPFNPKFQQRNNAAIGAGTWLASPETISSSSDTYQAADNGPSITLDPVDGKPMVTWVTGFPGADPNWNVAISKRTATNTWTTPAANTYTLPGSPASQSYPNTISGQSPALYVDYLGNLYLGMGRIDSEVDGSTSYSYIYNGAYNGSTWAWPAANACLVTDTSTCVRPYKASSTNCSTSFRYDPIHPGSVLDVDYVSCYEGWSNPSQAYMVYAHGALPYNAGTATPILCPNPYQVGNQANCVQPPILDFSTQKTGLASAPLSISLNNCQNTNITLALLCGGSGNLILSSGTYWTITGAQASEFTLSGGTCGAGVLVAPGGYCTFLPVFTPTATGLRTATLTVFDNGTTSSQTITLQGTGVASATAISACGALAASTNYYLTADVTAAGTCFTTSSAADLNLNGHTITYCNTSSANFVGGVIASTNINVHGGKILEGAGTCTGTTTSGGLAGGLRVFGSGAIVSPQNSDSGGTHASNLYINVGKNIVMAKVLQESLGGFVIHDLFYINNDSYDSTSTAMRDAYQGYSIIQSSGAQGGSPVTIYNVTGAGGTQGAILAMANGAENISNNLLNPGNALHVTSNGFAIYVEGSVNTIKNNMILGTPYGPGPGPGGSTFSSRGIAIAQPWNSARNICCNIIDHNTVITHNLNKNSEYGSSKNYCEFGGYAFQFNFGNNGNNNATNNTFQSVAHECTGQGYSDSGGDLYGGGPNKISNSSIVCSNGQAGDAVSCAGVRLDAKQYATWVNDSTLFTDDYIAGDTSDIYIFYDGTPSRTFIRPTFDKGPNAITSGWLFFNNCSGEPTGESGGGTNCINPGSGLITFIDPTFLNGISESSNNLSIQANAAASYITEFSQSLTVQKVVGGAPISGAVVTFTDAQSNQYTCTTNSSGQCPANSIGQNALILPKTKYAMAGSYSVTNYNPYSVTITASGYNNYSASGLSYTAKGSPVFQMASSGTYYIDPVNGSDLTTAANNSKATPWKTAPGFANATNVPLNYSTQPGDTLIFKAGLSIPYAAFPFYPRSGSSSTTPTGCAGIGCVTYTFDPTWLDASGCAANGYDSTAQSLGLCRPVIDGGGWNVVNVSCNYDQGAPAGTPKNIVIMNGQYIIFRGFHFKNMCSSNGSTPQYGNGFYINAINGDHNDISNNLVDGALFPSQESPVNTCFAGTSQMSTSQTGTLVTVNCPNSFSPTAWVNTKNIQNQTPLYNGLFHLVNATSTFIQFNVGTSQTVALTNEPAPGVCDPLTTCGAVGASADYWGFVVGSTVINPNPNLHTEIHDNFVDGTNATNASNGQDRVAQSGWYSGKGIYGGGFIVYRNIWMNLTQTIDTQQGQVIRDNLFRNASAYSIGACCSAYGPSVHIHTINDNGQNCSSTGSYANQTYLYNNWFQLANSQIQMPGGTGCSLFVFNNLATDLLGNATTAFYNLISSSANFYFFNLTCQSNGNTNTCYSVGSGAHFHNNFTITTQNPEYLGSPGDVGTTDRVRQTLAQANTVGNNPYAQTYPFAPTTATSPTVGVGTNESAFCNLMTPAEKIACMSDSTLGVLYDPANNNYSKYRWVPPGTARTPIAHSVGGAWPSGAMDFAASGVNIAPVSISFGTVTKNGSLQSSSVTLTNNSGSTLTFTGTTFTGTNGSDFTAFGNACTGTLSNNSSCTLAVVFKPTASPGTNETGTMRIAYTGGSGSPVTVALAGTSGNIAGSCTENYSETDFSGGIKTQAGQQKFACKP